MIDNKNLTHDTSTISHDSIIPCYAASQNGCILGIFDNYNDAIARVNEEIKRDFISIVVKKKLRKLFQKSGDVALHKYSVITITEVKEIK